MKSRIQAGRKVEIDDPKEYKKELNKLGVKIKPVKISQGSISLTQKFSNEQFRNQGILADLGTVAGVYIALVQNNAKLDTLTVTVVNSESEKLGSYSIAAEWAIAAGKGSLSIASYGEKVSGTLKTIQ